MKIQWLGHSSFKLTESTDRSVVTDPYHADYGVPFPEVAADAVTVSHAHRDHNASELVSGDPIVLNRVGSFELNGIHIYSVMSYHDDKKGSVRGKNLVFKFRMDGVEICHLGDIGEELSPMLAELLGAINVLLIPVGGHYTIDAEAAKDFVDKLMPDVVIPMHYEERDKDIDLDSVEDFLKYFDDENIIEIEGDTVEFDRADFDGENTKIYVLKRGNNGTK